MSELGECGWLGVCVCVGVLSVGLGPGLDSMSPARSRRSASHAAGTHGWLPQKTGRPGLRRGGVGGYNLYSVPQNSPPNCGTVALWHTNHEQDVSVWCCDVTLCRPSAMGSRSQFQLVHVGVRYLKW